MGQKVRQAVGAERSLHVFSSPPLSSCSAQGIVKMGAYMRYEQKTEKKGGGGDERGEGEAGKGTAGRGFAYCL